MKLSVHDRLMLQSLLPKEGNFINLKLVRKAKEALSFNEEELKSLKIQETAVDGKARITWNQQADTPKEVPLGDVIKEIVRKELKRLDETNKLSEDHVGLYEKFVNGTEPTLQ